MMKPSIPEFYGENEQPNDTMGEESCSSSIKSSEIANKMSNLTITSPCVDLEVVNSSESSSTVKVPKPVSADSVPESLADMGISNETSTYAVLLSSISSLTSKIEEMHITINTLGNGMNELIENVIHLSEKVVRIESVLSDSSIYAKPLFEDKNHTTNLSSNRAFRTHVSNPCQQPAPNVSYVSPSANINQQHVPVNPVIQQPVFQNISPTTVQETPVVGRRGGMVQNNIPYHVAEPDLQKIYAKRSDIFATVICSIVSSIQLRVESLKRGRFKHSVEQYYTKITQLVDVCISAIEKSGKPIPGRQSDCYRPVMTSFRKSSKTAVVVIDGRSIASMSRVRSTVEFYRCLCNVMQWMKNICIVLPPPMHQIIQNLGSNIVGASEDFEIDFDKLQQISFDEKPSIAHELNYQEQRKFAEEIMKHVDYNGNLIKVANQNVGF